jgi:hypothetical protein
LKLENIIDESFLKKVEIIDFLFKNKKKWNFCSWIKRYNHTQNDIYNIQEKE